MLQCKWRRRCFGWPGSLPRLGNAGGLGGVFLCGQSVQSSWVSAGTGFLVLASSVGPFLPGQPGRVEPSSACARPPTPDSGWEHDGGTKGVVRPVSPAGGSPDRGGLTGGLLCALCPQPPGAQRDQVHPPGSLLSLQKAAEDVSASHCFLESAGAGGRPRTRQATDQAGPASASVQAAAWRSCP